jgi:PHD/YefM family antitoxin component YafN of YafNO toxin-antitoxin module
MEFVTVRDFRTSSKTVWEKLEGNGKLVVTNNGKPQALMLEVSDANLEELLETIKQAETLRALAKAKAQSVQSNSDILADTDMRALIDLLFSHTLLTESVAAITKKRQSQARVRADEVLLRGRPQNFAEMVRLLELGTPGYVVNGDFLDEFYHAPAEARQSFIDFEPPPSTAPEADAVFYAHCAAVAEKLAHDYNLQQSSWVERPQYFLARPIYGNFPQDLVTEKMKTLMESDSPPEFSRRNLFVSSNALTRF